MGASEWSYRGKYEIDAMATLQEIKERILADGDYYWPDESKPRPGSVEELTEQAMLMECGTHSAVDVMQFTASDGNDEAFMIRPLSPAELVAAFGTELPGVADYERLAATGTLPCQPPRWSANCAFLYEDGKAVELAFWGCSGD